jgi:preprotein translocase subunit SecE
MARTQRRRSATATSDAPAASGEPSRRRRDNLPRPATAVAQPASSIPRPSAAPRRRRNPLAALGRFEPRWIADIVSELKKVTWPSWDETRHLTIVVSIVATVVGVSLGLIDLGFGWVIEKLLF